MRRWLSLLVFGLAAAHAGGSLTALTAPENLVAWCIVPYDNQARPPAQRIAMLQRLGLRQYVWDWRAEHVAQLPQELAAADAGGVRVRGVWLWIDGRHDRPGQLADANRFIIDTLKRDGRAMEYWVGFHENFFAGIEDAERVRKGAAMVAWLRDQAGPGGTILLYNHLDWFGEPDNQLRIIAAAGPERLGMVYNFHHAHAQLGRFADFLPRMLPYLRCVTLDGVNPDGPKILPIGAGTRERDLLAALARAGYRGPLAVLGHVEQADVEEILRANLDGLRTLAAP
jgi:sugar phosphate isomerase/epimerase